eukprot:COSAG04_NODE_1104_length_8239_cov_19.226658_5_plen_80_part_00
MPARDGLMRVRRRSRLKAPLLLGPYCPCSVQVWTQRLVTEGGRAAPEQADQQAHTLRLEPEPEPKPEPEPEPKELEEQY